MSGLLNLVATLGEGGGTARRNRVCYSCTRTLTGLRGNAAPYVFLAMFAGSRFTMRVELAEGTHKTTVLSGAKMIEV